LVQIVTDTTLNMGFLTFLHEATGYVGGYLVTNARGRPLEFRLSTAVQPNRVQQILYGRTMHAYIYADLIGKALVDKASASVQLILTDCLPALDIRLSLNVPVVWLSSPEESPETQTHSQLPKMRDAVAEKRPILCHPRYSDDAATIRAALDRLDGKIDLTEPFTRIRDAIGEARKMGIVNG